MKTNLLPCLLFVAFLGLFMQSCVKDVCEREVTYMKATPVYKTVDEIRTPIQTQAARDLKNPGKIYLHNGYIFINELREGIHIIDNSDPVNPQNIGFLPIPGNLDIAVNHHVLYADNYIDLVALDISDMTNVQLLNRQEEVFPFDGKNDEGGYAVYYDLEEVTEMLNCEDNNIDFEGGVVFPNGGLQDASVGTFAGAAATSTSRSATAGVAGSTSRFGLHGQYLYAVDNENLRLFNVNDIANPTFETFVQIDAGWNNAIETIFPHGDHLFIGSRSGMYIYDVSSPANPEFVSMLEHATACDPVFVYNDFAYVTLHDGSDCNGWTNQLDVVDVSNINNPQLINTVQMESPRGLTISDDVLFVCEGDFGMKVFDVSNPDAVGQNQLASISNISCFDVIAVGANNIILVIGENGLYQFDTSNPANLEQISFLSTK